MRCEWVKDHLLDYIDREIEASQELVIKEHLNDCDRCSHEYEKILDAWKALDLWEDLIPPARLQKNILGCMRRRREIKWWRMLAPVAAVFLIFIGIALYYRWDVTRNHHELTATNKDAPARLHTDITAENEADIIADLQLLREKEFYDSLDKLEKIDYLPLVEDQQKEDEGEQRSLLELFVA